MTSGTDWLEQAQRLFEVLRAPAPAQGEDAPGDGHAADCRWCPVCQMAAVVRGERPEVSEALADVLTATATALRTFAEAGADGSAPPAPEAPDDAEDDEPPAAVQRIDIA